MSTNVGKCYLMSPISFKSDNIMFKSLAIGNTDVSLCKAAYFYATLHKLTSVSGMVVNSNQLLKDLKEIGDFLEINSNKCL